MHVGCGCQICCSYLLIKMANATVQGQMYPHQSVICLFSAHPPCIIATQSRLNSVYFPLSVLKWWHLRNAVDARAPLNSRHVFSSHLSSLKGHSHSSN